MTPRTLKWFPVGFWGGGGGVVERFEEQLAEVCTVKDSGGPEGLQDLLVWHAIGLVTSVVVTGHCSWEPKQYHMIFITSEEFSVWLEPACLY